MLIPSSQTQHSQIILLPQITQLPCSFSKMKFAPVLLLLANAATLGSALPEPAPAPAPEALPEPEPMPEAKAVGSTIPILPPVDLPNPMSLLTVFGTCITGCVEMSIAKYTSCANTPTAKCVCPNVKTVLIQASPCFKTCKPDNLLGELPSCEQQTLHTRFTTLILTLLSPAQSMVLAAVACKIKGVPDN